MARLDLFAEEGILLESLDRILVSFPSDRDHLLPCRVEVALRLHQRRPEIPELPRDHWAL